MNHEDAYKIAGECGYDGDDKINVSAFANRIAEEYEREIEHLKAQIGAMIATQHEHVAWYIPEKDMITQDRDWALENSDICQPVVLAQDWENNEWIPDICDCDLDAKDNCELCTCGQAGYWQEIKWQDEEEIPPIPVCNTDILKLAEETRDQFYKTTFAVLDEMSKAMTFPMCKKKQEKKDE